MIMNDAGGNVPPTFLSIGNTIIAVAHIRPLLYISQNEVSQGLLQDVPLMAVVLHINRRSSLSLGQFLASVPELKYAQYLSMSGVLIAYSDALPSNAVLSYNFLTELIGYIIKEWCKEQKDA